MYFDEISQLSEDGKSWLSTQFQTCTPIQTEEDVLAFRDALYEFYWGTAQYDYPPYQVNATCRAIEAAGLFGTGDNRRIIQQIVAGVKVTQQGCFQIVSDPSENPSLGWEYQVSTRSNTYIYWLVDIVVTSHAAKLQFEICNFSHAQRW